MTDRRVPGAGLQEAGNSVQTGPYLSILNLLLRKVMLEIIERIHLGGCWAFAVPLRMDTRDVAPSRYDLSVAGGTAS